MKRELLAATALGTAVFYDVPVTRAETFNWAGTYVGGIAGYAGLGPSSVPFLPIGNGGSYDFSLAGGVPNNSGITFPAVPLLSRLSADGGTVGLEVGHNWQNGHFVYGGEGDFSALVLTGRLASARDGFSLGGPASTVFGVSAGMDWLSTVRGRVGYAYERALFFATGGLAFGGTHLSTGLGFRNFAKGAFSSGTSENVSVGYVLGGGVEYALTNHLSIKLEGLYFDLGRESVTAFGSATTGGGGATVQPYQIRYCFDGALARLGMNYRF